MFCTRQETENKSFSHSITRLWKQTPLWECEQTVRKRLTQSRTNLSLFMSTWICTIVVHRKLSRSSHRRERKTPRTQGHLDLVEKPGGCEMLVKLHVVFFFKVHVGNFFVHVCWMDNRHVVTDFKLEGVSISVQVTDYSEVPCHINSVGNWRFTEIANANLSTTSLWVYPPITK